MEENWGPVVQSIVNLMLSLRCQLIKYMQTTLSNPLLFFVEEMWESFAMQDSNIFPAKIYSVFVIRPNKKIAVFPVPRLTLKIRGRL